MLFVSVHILLLNKTKYNQNGFRPGRGIREHIFVLRRPTQHLKMAILSKFNLSCVISFFSSPKPSTASLFIRSFPPQILVAYRIPLPIIRAILGIYTVTKTKIPFLKVTPLSLSTLASSRDMYRHLG